MEILNRKCNKLEDESNIFTNLRGPSLSPFIDALVGSGFGIVLSLDPVEGFIVDGLGRRFGYSQASGSLTEIPSSFWLGGSEGLGWSTGVLQGPFELRLTGLGETYFLSLLIQAPDGVGFIETSGFLAMGEQLTLAVPFKHFPILDLSGSGDGVNFSTTFTAPSSPLAVTSPDLIVRSVDNPNLEEAYVGIANPLDRNLEFLSATPVGNIAVTYDSISSTLILRGNDSIVNYQQVLRTVTYTNTASPPTPTERHIEFTVCNGREFGDFSQVVTTTVIFPSAEIIIGTP